MDFAVSQGKPVTCPMCAENKLTANPNRPSLPVTQLGPNLHRFHTQTRRDSLAQPEPDYDYDQRVQW